ncbi:MAG TPA: hypothetical protein VFQ45_07665 [Longimicrobium sp.]|nr:hypothetical protein [Longimicrobium sp.]
MRKKKLAVEELQVESFDVTDAEGGRRGTVHAYSGATYCPTIEPRDCEPTDWGIYTCEGYGSCDPRYLCQDTHDPNVTC